MSWINRRIFFSILIFCLIGFVSLEIVSMFLTKNHLFLINEVPRLYKPNDQLTGLDSWLTESEEWGAWHKPNFKTVHSSSCYSVEYNSNEVGARDRPFELQSSKSRYLLIGDSFAEGAGVSDFDRAQSHIEKLTNKQVLDFGTGGDFGPVQYWLVYERLAKKYEHDGLIIFFLPSNDFVDNDYEHWSNTGATFFDKDKERYRPYYSVKDGAYEIFYPKNAVKRHGRRFEAKQFLRDNLWFYNALRTIKVTLLQKKIQQYEKQNYGGIFGQQYSGYFDPTVEQQNAAVHFIDKILSDSSAKDIVLVAIPRPEDFLRLAAGQKREQTVWWTMFKSAEERLKKSVTFVDLIDFKPEHIGSLFFTCDGHWSPYGNKWAAEIVSKSMRKNKSGQTLRFP